MEQIDNNQNLGNKKMILAKKILKDPLLMNQLCERVYQLMLLDLSQESERLKSYRKLG